VATISSSPLLFEAFLSAFCLTMKGKCAKYEVNESEGGNDSSSNVVSGVYITTALL
jgi:hypothetical protein